MTNSLHPVQQRSEAIDRVIAPTSVHDVLALMAEHGQRARVIAGGTDLLLEIERNARPGTEILIDLTRVAGGREITVEDEAITLAMGVTHADVIASPEIAAAATPLRQACLEIGSPQLRNRATVAGNLVTASPANDTISALMALDASVTLTSATGSRTVAVRDLYDGFRSTVITDAELLTAIRIPKLHQHQRGVFVKLGNRAAQAISVVHAAIVVDFSPDSELVELITIALGSVAPTVVMVDLDALETGRPLRELAGEAGAIAAASVRPIDDVRATAAYRSSTIGVMVERALQSIDGQVISAVDEPPPLLRIVSDRMSAPGTDVRDSDRVACTLNGSRSVATSAASKSLLDWLRDDHGVTGTKEGCAEGECGACTVHVDGEAVLACLVPAASVEGRDVTTVEGLASGDGLDPVQRAMERAGGVQCGFCTPGFAMSAAMLVRECNDLTTDQIVHGLSGNLCRCTGYYSIVDAVAAAARGDAS